MIGTGNKFTVLVNTELNNNGTKLHRKGEEEKAPEALTEGF
jgi:hypothetical protein